MQATLNAVELAVELEIPFHWLWILSGTTYPIASNDAIRAKLSSHHPESVCIVGGCVDALRGTFRETYEVVVCLAVSGRKTTKKTIHHPQLR